MGETIGGKPLKDHVHNGTDASKVDHVDLLNKGTNTHPNIDSHISSTSNPHSTTKAQVGLTNVTDDAQLKRSALDFQSFGHKTSPTVNDVFLIEDLGDSSNKKYASVGEIKSAIKTKYATFVVSNNPADNPDYSDIASAVSALPSVGGRILVLKTATTYVMSSSIEISTKGYIEIVGVGRPIIDISGITAGTQLFLSSTNTTLRYFRFTGFRIIVTSTLANAVHLVYFTKDYTGSGVSEHIVLEVDNNEIGLTGSLQYLASFIRVRNVLPSTLMFCQMYLRVHHNVGITSSAGLDYFIKIDSAYASPSNGFFREIRIEDNTGMFSVRISVIECRWFNVARIVIARNKFNSSCSFVYFRGGDVNSKLTALYIFENEIDAGYTGVEPSLWFIDIDWFVPYFITSLMIQGNALSCNSHSTTAGFLNILNVWDTDEYSSIIQGNKIISGNMANGATLIYINGKHCIINGNQISVSNNCVINLVAGLSIITNNIFRKGAFTITYTNPSGVTANNLESTV